MRFLTDEKGIVVLVGSDITAVKVSEGNLVSCADNDSSLFGYMLDNTVYQATMFTLHEDVSVPADLFPQGYTYTDGVFSRIESVLAPLDKAKSEKIAETKTALETCLAEHPLQWTDGKYYSVTADKQTLLNNALAVYQIAVQAGQTPELTWNATGEECAVWVYADLCALALGIAAFVKPLVSHQQALEVAIRAAATVDELESVVIDYALGN